MTRAPRSRVPLILAGVSAAALAAPALAGGPTGGTVIRGTAAISATAARTTIRQQSQRAVIDWQGFDVGRDHTVVFDQPGAGAATLNRVQSATPSVIAGAVKAPGTVVIQNGAGVLFTGDARVDVGGLVATAPRAAAGSFMRSGRLVLGGGDVAGARVVNRGKMTIGDAGLGALVGRDVENAGTIVARRGTVALAGGRRATLDLTGDGLVKIAVDGAGTAANAGTIDAGGGRVLVSAGAAAAAVEAAINIGGVIRGQRIEIAGRGKAGVAVTGRIDAARGTIAVTGRDIAITRSARVSAEEGRITAVARGTTRVSGAIEATGGFVETSAAGSVGVARGARVSVGSGDWLIDPRDIVIGASGAAPGPVPPGSTPLTISRVAIQNALDAGTDVTISTAQPASGMAGDITVAAPLSWTGAGDLTLLADRDITINAVIATGAGDFTARATRNLRLDADLRATGSAAVRLLAAQGYLHVARHSSSPLQTLTTAGGDLSLEATRGKLEIGRLGGESGAIRVGAASGALSLRAGTEIHIWGADADGGTTEVGAADGSGAVSLTAPAITVRGGAGPTSTAQLLAGRGGSLTLDATSYIAVTGTTAEGRVRALGGAPLTLRAPAQYWNGPVASGTGAGDGGPVLVSGAINAPVAPVFSLADGADFTLAARAPGSSATRYTSSERLAVSTGGNGRIAIEAPVSAAQVTLASEAGVRLGAQSRLAGTGGGDAVVVAAGRSLVNEAGADVLQGDRWLVYLDRFDGLTGTEPGGHGFDLYNRTLADAPPATIGFAGNRMIYAEQPTLTLTADSLAKTYGEAVTPGYTADGLRAGDDLATALDGAASVTSEGAAAGAAAGRYATRVVAAASAQGYALTLVDGSLTVDPARLTVTAADAVRTYGARNPDFSVTYEGFVLGEGPEALSGTLAFAAPDRESPVGRYRLTPSGLASANYDIRFAAGTVVVDPAPLTITAVDAARTYGAGNPAFTARFDGFVLGEGAGVLDGDLSFATDAGRGSDVGRYAVLPSGLASGNYAITWRPGTLTVDPAPLTVTAFDARRTYGAANPALGARIDGFVLGQDAGVLEGRLTLETDATRESDAGLYAISATGLDSDNYAITWREGTLTVDPAALTVTALDAARSYGAANPALLARIEGFVLGQDAGVLGGRLTLATNAGRAASVGRYAITASGLSSGNYAIHYQAGTLTVDPAALTVTALDATRAAGAANPAFAARFDGFVLDQDEGILGGRLRFATDAGADSPAGRYAVTPSGLTSRNYRITWAPGTLTVTAAPPPPVVPAAPSVGMERFARGVQPLTPGDASFRTTVAEAPPALANPFDLTYSLGEIVALAAPGAADTQGFTAAAGARADTQGFTPAAGGVQADAEEAGAGPCTGSVNRGSATAACAERTTTESFWASR